MAAVLELILEGQISPPLLIEWLDGLPGEGILQDFTALRIEFVPVFLNFLRDQSNGILQIGLTNGYTPSKCSSSVRAVKYVSPGKDHGLRARSQKQNSTSSKAKTLQFFDTPDKNSKHAEATNAPNVHQLLQETDMPLTGIHKTSPPEVKTSPPVTCLPKILYSSTPKGNSDKNYTANRIGCISPKFTSPEYAPHERHFRGKRQGLESDDRVGRGNFTTDKKHSEQRLSLGDFLSTETKWGSKKKSPIPRENSGIRSNSGSHSIRQLPKSLDIMDENAFPVMGCVPSQEKQAKRRINPTRITPISASRSNKSSPFNQSSKNLFGFAQGQSPSTPFMMSEEGSKTLDEEREMLRKERLKREEVGRKENIPKYDDRESPPQCGHAVQKPMVEKLKSDYSEASPDQVTNRSCLDNLAEVYSELILCNMVPSIMVELYYLVQLLTIRILVSEENENNESYLGNLHNCVYFATKVLYLLVELLKLLDRTTIKVLSENSRIQVFSKNLRVLLMKYLEKPPLVPILSQQPLSPIRGVFFQSDTDNRNNFSCDQAFRIFRKQRDLFYEIIRSWEENHLTPGWSYSQALGPRIRHILAMRIDPTNFAHFARLFQLQLLTMCRGEDLQFNPQQDPGDLEFLTILKKQHPEKFKRLHERLVTPSKLGGPCPAPSFPGSQEFFKDFIVTATNGTFNQYLKDILISHILQLNEQDFIVTEPDERDPVESMVHMEARSVVLNLRLLAKFLGFVEFLPYQTTNNLPENVIATHVSLRSKVYPPINLNAAFRNCASTGRLVIGITWIAELLSMVDPVALHSKHYLTVVMTLIAVFKILYITRNNISGGCKQCSRVSNSKNLAPSSSLLLKLLLGWLFDLPAFPDGLFFADIAEADVDQFEYQQNLKVLKDNYNSICVVCLRQMLTPGYDDKDSKLRDILMCTPSKNKVRKDKTLPQTPLKQENQEVTLTSPFKTPSKYMSVGMLETPETTPLKVLDSSQDGTEAVICLDISHFVDQQLITICCPFVCELKNLLNDYAFGVGSSKSTGSNSGRRITPLSASDKESSGTAQMHLQLQLEENFFHNHPSSVRKTTEFVIERVSSNIIKKIRMTIIPEFRENALEKLKAIIESQVQNAPTYADFKKEEVKCVAELSQDICARLKTHCLHLLDIESQEQVNSVLVLLLPPDVTAQEVDICRKLVFRSSAEKVCTWTQCHLTPALFSKELSLDSERLFRQAQKTADYQAMTAQVSHDDTTLSMLDSSDASTFGGENSFLGYHSSFSLADNPLSPTNQPVIPRPITKKSNVLESLPVIAKDHDFDVMAPSHILKLLKVMILRLISSAEFDLCDVAQDVQDLIHNVKQVISKREDVTLTLFRALEALTVDLAIAVAGCIPSVMTLEIQEGFVSLWKPVEEGGLMPSPCGLLSFMCPRTVMLIAQNPLSRHQAAAWKKMEEFLTLLLSSELLSPASLQQQCISLLRHSWPQEILAGLSSCIKGISKNCQKQTNFADDPTFTELLEWVGWVCGEMEEFPELL